MRGANHWGVDFHFAPGGGFAVSLGEFGKKFIGIGKRRSCWEAILECEISLNSTASSATGNNAEARKRLHWDCVRWFIL